MNFTARRLHHLQKWAWRLPWAQPFSPSGTKGKRLALPNLMILIHQPSSGVQGQQTDIQIVADETKWIREHLNQMLADATGQPIEKINADTERDNYMRA